MEPIGGIVLCGGTGSRFNGADKPLLELNGRPLVEHVLERLEGQVDRTIISANRNTERYASLGHPVVHDRQGDSGPLAGILAATSSEGMLGLDLCFVCPGDSPFLPGDVVGRLMSSLTPALDAVVVHDGQRLQHLFMLLRRSAAASLGPYLDTGGRSVRGWLETLRYGICQVNEPAAFTNVNTPQELLDLEGNTPLASPE